MKLDQLIELYMEDRKRFQTLPLLVETQPQSDTAPVNTVSTLKPKPILVDKVLSRQLLPRNNNYVESSTVSVTRRPMHRGFSDLGNRIKKRVTLR